MCLQPSGAHWQLPNHQAQLDALAEQLVALAPQRIVLEALAVTLTNRGVSISVGLPLAGGCAGPGVKRVKRGSCPTIPSSHVPETRRMPKTFDIRHLPSLV